MARRSSPFPTAGLVLVRLVTALVLLVHGWRWLAGGGPDGALIRRAVDTALADGRTAFEWWGREVLLWNPDAIAFLWPWLALGAGASLFLGALVRPVGTLAAFFLANAWMYGLPAQRLLFLVLAASAFACVLGRAGARLGLDGIFDQHFPGWLTWTRSGRGSFLQR
ncbi:MAG: hypothetical protein AB1726_04930 [Planctomycetota bacterium]